MRPQTASSKQPDISNGAIECRFRVINSRSVFVDEERRLIHFGGCHVPRRFLSTVQPWFICPASDVRAVHIATEGLTIVTSQGKAFIPADGENFDELRNAIRRLVPSNQPGLSAEHPMMGLGYVFGAIVGLFVGWSLVPMTASDSTLVLSLLAGPCLGVAIVHFLVCFIDQHSKVGLVQPLGFAMAGAIAGLPLGGSVAPFFDWNLIFLLAPAVIGATIGGIYGYRKASHEQRSVDSPPEPVEECSSREGVQGSNDFEVDGIKQEAREQEPARADSVRWERLHHFFLGGDWNSILPLALCFLWSITLVAIGILCSSWVLWSFVFLTLAAFAIAFSLRYESKVSRTLFLVSVFVLAVMNLEVVSDYDSAPWSAIKEFSPYVMIGMIAVLEWCNKGKAAKRSDT